MKKHILIIGVTFLLLSIALTGCQEEKKTEKLVKAPVKTLVLTIDDLPAGFSEDSNASGYSAPGFTDIPTESYFVQFIGNYSNQTTEIQVGIYKLKSSEKASTNQNSSITYITTFGEGEVKYINDSIGKIGDESSAFSKEGYNATYTIIYFRISNVVVYMMTNNNYSFLYDLAKIVEQRIYSSMS